MLFLIRSRDLQRCSMSLIKIVPHPTPSIAVPEAGRGSYCLCYKAASVRRSKGPFDAIEAYLKNYFVRGDEYFDVIVWFISFVP